MTVEGCVLTSKVPSRERLGMVAGAELLRRGLIGRCTKRLREPRSLHKLQNIHGMRYMYIYMYSISSSLQPNRIHMYA